MRTQCDHRAVWRVDKSVVCVHRQALAMDAVALRVRRAELGHGVPATHIAPSTGKRHYRDVVVMLHYRIVNALGAAGSKRLRLGAQELTVLCGADYGLTAGLQNVRSMLLQGGQQGCGATQKNTPVP